MISELKRGDSLIVTRDGQGKIATFRYAKGYGKIKVYVEKQEGVYIKRVSVGSSAHMPGIAAVNKVLHECLRLSRGNNDRLADEIVDALAWSDPDWSEDK